MFTNPTVGVTTANIIPAPVTLMVPVINKTYDGGLTYTPTAGNLTSLGSPLVSGDSVTAATIEYTDKNAVASNKTVNLSAVTINDGNSGNNYTVTLTGNSTSTITPASLAINAGTDSRAYNGTLASTGAVSVGTLYSTDTVTGTSQAFLSKDVKGSNGSTLSLTGYAVNDGNGGHDYTVTRATAAGTITPAAPGIAANSAARLYGDANPAFSATYTGFQNGETAAALSGMLALATPAIRTSNVGNYAITPSGQSSANYTITYVNGTLGVPPVSLMVAPDTQSKVYGTSDPILTFSATGLINNPALGITDTASSVLSGALARVPGETVAGGPYAITQGSLAAGSNYTLGFTHSNLLITGAAAEPVLGAVAPIISFNAGQLIFAGVINNDSYNRPGNFWHISLNYDNADPGFDVMRGTNDSTPSLSGSLNGCAGEFCETWSFPQQFEKVLKK